MTLKIYNTLTRKKEEFIPVDKRKVKMYVCGMTVYSDAHIGHARTYLAFDIMRRYFEYKGYDVTYIQNITDVDDKIISAANRNGIDALEYSKQFADICFKDIRGLGIKDADVYPKASETVDDMIEMIKQILNNGYGYVADGDVYFSVEKFQNYGRLSGQKLDEMKVEACKLTGEKKHNPFDFALWKKAKSGEPFWDSPWGKGRPGWHIECSTMSSKYLGLPFDIHGGGMDLKFPHHENEIAQAEAATGKQFARYWMHIGLLTVKGEKMSKSLGNIINIRDAIKRWDPESIRFFFVQAHYRSPPDFNENALHDAKKSLERIHRLKERLKLLCKNTTSTEPDVGKLTSPEKHYLSVVEEFKKRFENAMDDDFNTSQAIANLFEFVNLSNHFLEENDQPDSAVCKKAHDLLVCLGQILTLFQKDKIVNMKTVKVDDVIKLVEKYGGQTTADDTLEKMLDKLLLIRETARKEKKWEKADRIRDDLQKLGFEIQDTNKGSIWRKK
jgi:cysteinyl-tRNA synthetase